MSEVFDFTTRPEIFIANPFGYEHAARAVLSWEANLRTDTTLKYGKTDRYDELRTSPEQGSETARNLLQRARSASRRSI